MLHIAFPQAELSIPDRIPARGKWKFCMCISVEGTVHRNNYKISACGDVKFSFPQAELRFRIVFPRGGNVNFHVHARGDGAQKSLQNLRLRRCKILIAYPASGTYSGCIPARGKCKFSCISARERRCKILHPRKRRFCNYFCAPSPRAEITWKFTFPP